MNKAGKSTSCIFRVHSGVIYTVNNIVTIYERYTRPHSGHGLGSNENGFNVIRNIFSERFSKATILFSFRRSRVHGFRSSSDIVRPIYTILNYRSDWLLCENKSDREKTYATGRNQSFDLFDFSMNRNTTFLSRTYSFDRQRYARLIRHEMFALFTNDIATSNRVRCYYRHDWCETAHEFEH